MPSTERASAWSLTINNPNENDEEYINLARQKGWKVEGQKEVGKEGTIHYQLMLKTPQTRFSTIKKAFPRAHIEVARNVAALEQYVHKEETKVGELNTQSEKYPSLSKYWELVYDYCNERCLLDWSEYSPPDWWSKGGFLTPKPPLDILDCATRHLIREGYYVETMAVNPQNRSAFQKFGLDIFFRIWVQRQDRDRQQAELSREESITTDADEESISSQTVSVPTFQEERDEAL